MKSIGIFCGGFSSEYDISIKSAQTILNHFPTGYHAVKVEVKREGWHVVKENARYELDRSRMCWNENGQELSLDAGIIYIHGNPGENGKLQAYFDLIGFPYVNSGALASELSFDKWYCNQFLSNFDIPVAKSIFLSSHEEADEEQILSELGLPVFVKPSDSGSSYGISKVNTTEELQPALEKAFAEGGTVVIEAFLDGTEVTCGVYRRKSGIHTLPLTEIVSENEFFDYKAKYLGESSEITPARIPEEQRDKVWEIASKCYRLLNLKSIARIDFMIVHGVPHVIEVNTTPGFSDASLVPQMLNEDGISISDFWEEILAVELK